jgi:hypothetical protein
LSERLSVNRRNHERIEEGYRGADQPVGGGLLRARMLPSWISWASITWNPAWLVVLTLLTPRNIYYPALHHFKHLLIGGALLRRSGAWMAWQAWLARRAR